MIEIIPALDLIGGECVRLRQGDYAQKTVYSHNPLDVAKSFQDSGIRRLHLVDLDGARTGQIQNLAVLESIASNTALRIDYGGGINTDAAIESVFSAGAEIATVGSIAIQIPELFIAWIKKYGADRILLGADVKNERLAIHGWKEITSLYIFDYLKQFVDSGLKQFFCTDVAKDGLLEGPSVDLYQRLISAFPKMEIIASGGVTSIEDINTLDSTGCAGVIIGKALYEGRISLDQLKSYLP
jgi:phosphoribosylformimino-5-aminoimidazole carboxamide ribotide isomerase